MEKSKYYAQNQYLNSIFVKQDRQKINTIPEPQTPYHFRKKTMNPFQKNQIMQLKILQNPNLYLTTHIKCSVCNIYVQINDVDHHSFIHLQQQQKIDRILSGGRRQ